MTALPEPSSSPESMEHFPAEGFRLGTSPMSLDEIINELRFVGVLPYQGLKGTGPRVKPKGPYFRFRRDYNSMLDNLRRLHHRADTRSLHESRLQARDWLQTRLQEHPDLLNDAGVATNAMWLGAIPLEDMGFRHTLQPNFSYACVDGHGLSKTKYVDKSVWIRGMNAGSGQVASIPIAWCEPCGDSEPPENGRYITYVGIGNENMWGL